MFYFGAAMLYNKYILIQKNTHRRESVSAALHMIKVYLYYNMAGVIFKALGDKLGSKSKGTRVVSDFDENTLYLF
ncbi:Hypothetical protein UCCLBBS124_pA0051 (plasmid) [Levilactobacillus brevis]|nr:Hypothetical protein UCCLBBS124_pA0051 [Levilactobacillus brevis]